MATITETLFQEDALLYRLHLGEPEAFNKIIYHFGGNMNIVAYALLNNSRFANQVVRDLFLKLQEEKYKNARVPLRIYLYEEIKAASERFAGQIQRDYEMAGK